MRELQEDGIRRQVFGTIVALASAWSDENARGSNTTFVRLEPAITPPGPSTTIAPWMAAVPLIETTAPVVEGALLPAYTMPKKTPLPPNDTVPCMKTSTPGLFGV